MSKTFPAPDDALFVPLRRVAMRRRTGIALRVALAAAIVVLMLVLLEAGLTYLGVPLPFADAIVVVGGGLALLAGGVWAYRQRRTVDELAFSIDRLSGLGQAYGTAIDLTRHPRRAVGPVAEALMASARRDAGDIAADRLVRVLTPGVAVALACTVALAAGLYLITLNPAVSPQVEGDPQPAVATPVDAETIETVAELMAADAEANDDAFLAAVARALQERIEALEGEPASEAMRAELSDLLDQAAQAYGSDVPDWLGEAGGDRLADLDQRLADFMSSPETAASAAAGERAASPGFESLVEQPAPRGMYEIDASLGERFAGRDEDVVISNVQSTDPLPGDVQMGDLSPDSEGPRLMEPQELQAAGSMPVGAALQSGRGESDAAGLGAETFEFDDAFIGIEAGVGEDMVLSAETEPGGSRIRMEVVPQAAAGAGQGAAGEIAGGGEAGAGMPVQRQFVPADTRAITARYFERLPQ